MSETIIDLGIVVGVDENRARVRIVESGACDSCNARLICKPGKSDKKTLIALNKPEAKVGDYVKLQDSDNLLLKVALIQFGLPLMGLITGILITYPIKSTIMAIPHEFQMFLAGCLGVALCGISGRYILQRIVKTSTAFFEITSIVERHSEPDINNSSD